MLHCFVLDQISTSDTCVGLACMCQMCWISLRVGRLRLSVTSPLIRMVHPIECEGNRMAQAPLADRVLRHSAHKNPQHSRRSRRRICPLYGLAPQASSPCAPSSSYAPCHSQRPTSRMSEGADRGMGAVDDGAVLLADSAVRCTPPSSAHSQVADRPRSSPILVSARKPDRGPLAVV